MHFEKYHKNQVMKLLQHYTREHITDNVNRERMKDNVYCCNQVLKNWAEENEKKIDSDMLSGFVSTNILKRQKRKFRDDQVVMIDLIITQPIELGTTYNKDFFDKCISVINKDYVKQENFLYYSIHNDEKGQPHLHYSFMPFMKDKKGNEKLCAKEFLTRDFLKSFHQDMEQKTGYKLTSEDKNIKNLSMQQYQNKKDIERLQNEIVEQKEKIKRLQNEIIKLKQEKENLQKEIVDIKWKSQTTTTQTTHIDVVKQEVLKDITNIIDDYKKGMTPQQILNDKNIFEYNIVNVKAL